MKDHDQDQAWLDLAKGLRPAVTDLRHAALASARLAAGLGCGGEIEACRTPGPRLSPTPIPDAPTETPRQDLTELVAAHTKYGAG